MRFIRICRLVVFGFLFFLTGLFAEESFQSPTIFQSDHATLEVSRFPLSPGSVDVFLKVFSIEKASKEHFSDVWKARRLAESHFSKKGYSNRLCYSKIASDLPLKWQIVPYSFLPWYFDNFLFRKIYSVFKQAQILYQTTFSPKSLSDGSISSQMPFWNDLDFSLEEEVKKTGTGILTEKRTIQKQLVYPPVFEENKEQIFLLYNYAPLNTGGEQMHFLIVPSPENPARNFLELDKNQYVATLSIAKKVIMWAQEKFNGKARIYFFDKTGKIAGQTQELYHAHLLIVSDKKEEFLGKTSMFLRMLYPPHPLSAKELLIRVSRYKKSFNLFLHKLDNEKL